MMILRLRKIYFLFIQKDMLTLVIPEVMLRAQSPRKRRYTVGSPGGCDTGEGRWGATQQISDTVLGMEKCCGSMREKNMCIHARSCTHACTHIHTKLSQSKLDPFASCVETLISET